MSCSSVRCAPGRVGILPRAATTVSHRFKVAFCLRSPFIHTILHTYPVAVIA